MTRLLITGASGLLGANLVLELVEEARGVLDVREQKGDRSTRRIRHALYPGTLSKESVLQKRD